MEILDDSICVWLHYTNLPPYAEREKNHCSYIAFGKGGNPTCAVIHCSIANTFKDIIDINLKYVGRLNLNWDD